MHLSPGNSKVNTPPPLEIPRLIHPLPWKFQGSSTGGVRIIIGIAHFRKAFDFVWHEGFYLKLLENGIGGCFYA
jgi:hypothetical protein